MKNNLGSKSFITWHSPKESLIVGNIKISTGNAVRITTKTTTSSSQSFWPTVSLEYAKLDKGELSLWVLFHAFITENPWTLPSYMQTIQGVVEFLSEPMRSEEIDHEDFLNIAYRTEGITQKMSYRELYGRFVSSLDEQKVGMVKNLLLDMKPGPQYSHSEMADYSYWRMVIDYSIVDAIVGQQTFCEETKECLSCKQAQLLHHPTSAKKWLEDRLLEIADDTEKAEQYMKVIWAVRQNIRHSTVHTSAYPYNTLRSELQVGDNEFDVDAIINSFNTDKHALTALVDNMHQVTRILLLNNILETGIFPDIRTYMVRSGGMNWEEFLKLVNQKK